jgi:hypothetical protein
MKTDNVYDNEQTLANLDDKMEAIASGVRARFEEGMGYSKMITNQTISIARSLGVPNSEIERWAAQRLNHIADENARFQEIKALLTRAYSEEFNTA